MPEASWDISIAELNRYLELSGVEPIQRDGVISGLDGATRAALVRAVRESVSRARAEAPPVERWITASESLFMDDDGSQAARQRQENFWQSLTRIVNGCFAGILLGDSSEFPFFVDLLKHRPAGHLVEMATGVARHYVDPTCELDAPQLVQRAEEWWNSLSAQDTGRREISG